MSRWVLSDGEGRVMAQLHMPRGEKPGALDNPAGLLAERVRRFGKPGERRINGAWHMVDGEAAAAAVNAAHLADHGAFAIDQSRRQKATEARLMLLGHEINGLVAAEAAATGQNALELAQKIADAAAITEAVEVNRIVARMTLRAEVKAAPTV